MEKEEEGDSSSAGLSFLLEFGVSWAEIRFDSRRPRVLALAAPLSGVESQVGKQMALNKPIFWQRRKEESIDVQCDESRRLQFIHQKLPKLPKTGFWLLDGVWWELNLEIP